MDEEVQMIVGKLHELIRNTVPYWNVDKTKNEILDWVEKDFIKDIKNKSLIKKLKEDIRREREWTPRKN
jgi:hypothetical protein